jgi:hypothetical protein
MTGGEAGFFASGRQPAPLTNAQPLPHKRGGSFQDTVELLKLLTLARFELYQSMTAQTRSIFLMTRRRRLTVAPCHGLRTEQYLDFPDERCHFIMVIITSFKG